MTRSPQTRLILPSLPRRRFLEGLAGGGVILGLSAWLPRTFAQAPSLTATGTPPVLSGTEFDLTIAETPVNFTGTPGLATTINGSIPGPVLRWREGDTVTLRVTNRMREPTSLHWHGILLPFEMDGVPGISFRGIAPGESFVYRFPVRQNGTYWYHSHSGFQEQTGMYGARIIDSASGDTIRADRDYVVQLADWTDENPMRVFAKPVVELALSFRARSVTDRSSVSFILRQAQRSRVETPRQGRSVPAPLRHRAQRHSIFIVSWKGL